VCEWIAFNVPPDTIQVIISEAELYLASVYKRRYCDETVFH